MSRRWIWLNLLLVLTITVSTSIMLLDGVHFLEALAVQGCWIVLVGLLEWRNAYLRRRALTLDHTFRRWLAVGTDLLISLPWQPRRSSQEWRPTFTSPSWFKVLGYTEKELLSTSWCDLLHPDDQAAAVNAAYTMKDKPLQQYVNRYRHKEPNPDGSPRWVPLEWCGALDPNSDQVFASGRDISDRVRTEAQLRLHVEHLLAANEDLQKFASVAAHQLRSPPRTISGIAQALLEDYGSQIDEGGRQFLRDILSDANSMAEVVDGLYRISKVRNVAAVATEPVDLNLIMQDIADTRRKGWTPVPGRPCKFTWDTLPIVRGDRVLLTEVFANLIDNGFKFNRAPEKHVHVSVDTPQSCPHVSTCTFHNRNCWCIKVTDNGVGIPMEYRHKLFEMFERLHPEFPGTGVGLALVQTIVRKIGGEVMVQPNPNGPGTVFCLGLPRS